MVKILLESFEQTFGEQPTEQRKREFFQRGLSGQEKGGNKHLHTYICALVAKHESFNYNEYWNIDI